MVGRARPLIVVALLSFSCVARPTPGETPSITPLRPMPSAVASLPSPTPLIGFAGPTPTVGPTPDPSLQPSPTVTPAPLITAAAPAVIAFARNRVMELDFNYPSTVYSNPIDDAVLTLTIQMPSGKETRLGGFYYDVNTWKVRYVPPLVGHYAWQSQFTDKFGGLPQVDSGEFDVIQVEQTAEPVESAQPQPVDDADRGWVRIYERNRFRFVFDDGTPFYAVGLQDCLDDGNRNGDPFDDFGMDGRLVGLETYLDTYAAAGFNLWRWSADACGFKLWDRIAPEGNIYRPQEALWLDQLFTALRAKGFRIYANLFAKEPPFPQDSANGPKMNAALNYVRYFVNRYAAYVDFWELMSQATADLEWYNLIAGAVREADPYDHPIATNHEQPGVIVIDVIAPHWYESEYEYVSDFATADRIRAFRTKWLKPIVFSEQGNAGVNWDETSARRMRLRAWTAFFEEATLIFANSSWRQDYTSDVGARLYLGPEERQYIRSLQDFTAGFDPLAAPVVVEVSAPELARAYALRSANAFAAYVVAYTDHENPTSGIKLTADLPFSGTAIWYNPSNGETVATTNVKEGKQTLDAPDFVTDLAVKVMP